MNFDWIIVGGGIHGVHLAARLIAEGGVAEERLAIVDPASRLLQRWRLCTNVTGMSHLRSPAVHHLDVAAASLRQFAAEQKLRGLQAFAEPYFRPSLALFNSHCDHVISKFGLADLHCQERALSCIAGDRSVFLRLSQSGWVEARQVIFAIGASERPLWPEWAPNHAKIHHIFQPGFDGWPKSANERVTVIGGGISAAQLSLRLLEEGHRVRLITRHAFREHRFDSDPGWLGPRFTAEFQRQRSSSRRRDIIRRARHRGSIPPETHRLLRRAIYRKQIVWQQQEVEELIPTSEVVYVKYASGLIWEADRVLLATGFEPQRPGGRMIDSLVKTAALPCGACGYPLVDRALRWHRRISVSGPLAELEIGPIARNIAGARAAGDRIISNLSQPTRTRAVQLYS